MSSSTHQIGGNYSSRLPQDTEIIHIGGVEDIGNHSSGQQDVSRSQFRGQRGRGQSYSNQEVSGRISSQRWGRPGYHNEVQVHLINFSFKQAFLNKNIYIMYKILIHISGLDPILIFMKIFCPY